MIFLSDKTLTPWENHDISTVNSSKDILRVKINMSIESETD